MKNLFIFCLFCLFIVATSSCTKETALAETTVSPDIQPNQSANVIDFESTLNKETKQIVFQLLKNAVVVFQSDPYLKMMDELEAFGELEKLTPEEMVQVERIVSTTYEVLFEENKEFKIAFDAVTALDIDAETISYIAHNYFPDIIIATGVVVSRDWIPNLRACRNSIIVYVTGVALFNPVLAGAGALGMAIHCCD